MYKLIFWVVKRELPEAPRPICPSYFLPPEGKMFSTILDTQHYRIQTNKKQSRNKIVTSLPTNPYIILDSHALLPTSTSRCAVKQ